ncbi:MAG: glycosyltransferase family 39 protein [Pyrinomonadaceae bacterium]
MLLAVTFAVMFVPQNSGSGYWNVGAWYGYLLRYDAGWYLTILKHGYTYDGNDAAEHPVAFFPLYPLSCKLATLLGVDTNFSLVLVSNLAILVAIPLTYKLISDHYSKETALCTVALLSFFPTSLFFSAGYAESLSLLLIISFFLLLGKERYLLAAACAGLAHAARPTSIVLFLPLAWALWRRFSHEPWRLVLSLGAYAIIATSGLWLYMLYLWVAFGKPLAFASALGGWAPRWRMSLLEVLTLRPFEFLGEVWKTGLHPNSLDPWFFLLFVALIAIFWKRLPTSFALFAAGSCLLPYLTRSGTWGFMSFTRYILLIFPAFAIAGELLKRSVGLSLTVTGLLAAMLFMYTVMFAQWYWVG